MILSAAEPEKTGTYCITSDMGIQATCTDMRCVPHLLGLLLLAGFAVAQMPAPAAGATHYMVTQG